MNDAASIHALSEGIAVLDERMKTAQAGNGTLKADLAATLSGMRADMATHREDAAKRETRLILAVAVIVGVGLTIFGFLTASPGV